MPVSARILAIIEQRMREFLESRMNKKVLPIALTLTDGIMLDVERILLQRFTLDELTSSEHASDSHAMRHCHLCQSSFHYVTSKHRSDIDRFLSLNRDLFAEVELSS